MSAVISVQGLGKRYRLFNSPRARLASLLGLADLAHAQAHWALHNISFELHPGQCLGVVGDNGAGKSTLLKLLTGTLQPTQGQVQRVGRLTAILELGAGFHPDFSGRDNLQFGASLIGLGPTEMARLTPSIIEFSELGAAIDRPVKTYSSGMVVRLAFALVTAVQPEVLIIDEALAVGDQNFQKKCVQRIEAFRQNGCTILFCSHSLYHVRQLCDQVLWLDQGEVRGLGDTEDVVSAYETHTRLQAQAALPASTQSTALANADSAATDVPSTTEVEIPPRALLSDASDTSRAALPAALVSARVLGLGAAGAQSDAPRLSSAHLVIDVQATSPTDQPPSVGVMLEQFKGIGITSVATHAEGAKLRATGTENGHTQWQVTLTFNDLPLHSGQYALSFYLFDAQGLVIFDEWKDHIVFQWVSPSLTPGLVRLPHSWS